MEDHPELGFPPGYWESSEEENHTVGRDENPTLKTSGNKPSDSKDTAAVVPGNQTFTLSETELSDDASSLENEEEKQPNRRHGSLRPSNEVRVSQNGQLQWRREIGDPWRNAVYHSTIRDDLIAEANQRGKYKYPRAKGEHVANDVTCFHQGQEKWGKQRDDWPQIVLQYLPGEEYHSQKKAGFWFTQEGLLIIDVHKNPVLNYPGIPHTLSSMIEPVFMEAYCRLSKQITQTDLRARMVNDPKGGQYNGQGKDPIRIGNLSMRMTRFRLGAGCISWGARKGEGSENLKKYMDKKLPQHCKDANSIRGFRNLHKHEIAEMKLNNVGLFLERARRSQSGPKDLSADKTRTLYRKAYHKFRFLKTKFEAEEALKAAKQVQAETKPDSYSSDEENDDEIEEIESSEGGTRSGKEEVEIGNNDQGVSSENSSCEEVEDGSSVEGTEDKSSDDEMGE